jgi:thymidylate kinase
MYTVISGADGSGKTTVVRLLASYLSRYGTITIRLRATSALST